MPRLKDYKEELTGSKDSAVCNVCFLKQKEKKEIGKKE